MMGQNKISLYLVSVLLFMLVLPVASIFFEGQFNHTGFGWALIGKWFVFWAIGARLFIAGLKQVAQPAFTARQIFKISNPESFVIVRELGFANICMGLLGLLSIANVQWRPAAAVTGGLYFGLAGILHLFKKVDSRNELIALVSDLYIFAIMVGYLSLT